MKTEKILGAGALGAGFLASLCCVGPLVFAALGLGAFGAGAFFESARPILGLILVTCGVGGLVMAYRKREVACEDGSCRVESAGKGAKVTLWILLAAGMLMFMLPYYL